MAGKPLGPKRKQHLTTMMITIAAVAVRVAVRNLRDDIASALVWGVALTPCETNLRTRVVTRGALALARVLRPGRTVAS